jgi:hypothetical protein
VSRLLKYPREEDRKVVDQLREILTTQFGVLYQLQLHATTGMFMVDHTLQPEDEPLAFDDIDDIDQEPHEETQSPIPAEPAAFVTAPDSMVEPPETRRLSIPSTWVSTDNIHRGTELQLRIRQASKTLQALHETIADKSF